MRIALWASLIAGLGVVGLAIFDRRSGRHDDGLAERRQRAERRRRSPWLAAALVVLTGVLAGPAVAVWAMIVLVIAPRVRWFAAATVLATGAIVAGSIVALEWRHDYPAGPDWPDRFGWTSPLVWAAVATVVVVAIMPDGVRLPGRGPRQTDVAATHAS
jgi:MFS family permease